MFGLRPIARSSTAARTHQDEIGWRAKVWAPLGQRREPGGVHPVCQAVGMRLCERDAVFLRGMRKGSQSVIGACVLNGERLAFDFWFPHLGIAVDTPETRNCRSEAVVEAKASWCAEREVIYMAPDDFDLRTLAGFAERRRSAVTS